MSHTLEPHADATVDVTLRRASRRTPSASAGSR